MKIFRSCFSPEQVYVFEIYRSKMKISFFGSSLLSAYWNGAATYYRGILKALHAKGHQITFYEPDAFDRLKNRDIDDPDYARVVIYYPNENDALKMLEEASDADLLVKASGVGVLDAFLEDAVVRRKRPDQVLAFWDVDAPATLYRVQQDNHDPFRNLIPQYDFIFTYGGGDPVVNQYEQLGARQCIPVYNALDADSHFPEKANARFAGHLGFLGNRLPDREQRVEEFFIKPARLLPEFTFVMGGNGWHDKGLPSNIKYLGHVSSRDHNAFNSSSMAILNVCRESMASNGFSPPTRVFEAAGAGACLITDYWEGIEMFLEPDKEVLVARNGEEVAEILQTLTKEVASNIGRQGYQRVMNEHTYLKRAEQLELVFNELKIDIS